MSQHNATTLKQAINKLIDTYKLRGKLNEAKLNTNWEKLFGKTIAKYTQSIYLKDKKLYVKITSSPLKQELLYNKPKMINLLNEDLGENVVTDIVIL